MGRKIIKENSNEIRKCIDKGMFDNMVSDIFLRMQLIGYNTLLDRYDFSREQLIEYWEHVTNLYNDYCDNKVSSKFINDIVVQKYEIDIKKWLGSIPKPYINQMALLVGCMKPDTLTKEEFLIVVKGPFHAYYMIAAYVLIKYFNFTKEDVRKFGDNLNYYIDSMCRGFITPALINELLITECGIDAIGKAPELM